MFKFAIALLAVSALAGPALAMVPIAGLINTGRTADNSSVSNGAVVDAHWTLAGGTAWNGSNINSNWLANNNTSRWLTPAANGNQSFDRTANGFYTFALRFDLTGFLPDTALFTARFMADNVVTAISLNGNALAFSGPTGNQWFRNWSPLMTSSGFVGGINTLSFTVRNDQLSGGDNPTGLRVEFTESAVNAVPEPASWAMLIGGFGLVGAAARRRRMAAA